MVPIKTSNLIPSSSVKKRTTIGRISDESANVVFFPGDGYNYCLEFTGRFGCLLGGRDGIFNIRADVYKKEIQPKTMIGEQLKDKAVEITKNLLKMIGFEGEVKVVESGSYDNQIFTISIESDKDLSMLIGKNGQNLNALDHIIRLLVIRQAINTSDENPLKFIVDVNDYRKSRTNYLIEIARTVARRVIQTQKAEALLPMSSYERRLVHTELASFKEVQTESIGQEPRRRIVVKPQLDNQAGF